MTNDYDYDADWLPLSIAREFQTAGERAFERQTEFARRLFEPSFEGGMGQFVAMSERMATFKTRVQSGGRIGIPDAEREALGIRDGDLVQTVVIPLDDRGEGERDE